MYHRALGQDGVDFGVPDLSPLTDPTASAPLYPEPSTTVPWTPPAPADTSIYDIQYGAPGVAPTAGTYEQQAGVQAGNIAPTIAPTSLLQSLMQAGTQVAGKALAPGPAPRVNAPTSAMPSSLLTSSIVSGIPNIAIFAVLAVVGISLVSGGGRRRR